MFFQRIKMFTTIFMAKVFLPSIPLLKICVKCVFAMEPASNMWYTVLIVGTRSIHWANRRTNLHGPYSTPSDLYELDPKLEVVGAVFDSSQYSDICWVRHYIVLHIRGRNHIRGQRTCWSYQKYASLFWNSSVRLGSNRSGEYLK